MRLARSERLFLIPLGFGVVVTGGCSDGPTSPGVPANVVAQAGTDDQHAPAGFPVPTPPAVVVTDEDGTPVPGVVVTFEVASGGGSITGPTPSTGSDGVARVGSWTLGPELGNNTLRATVSGLPPVTFTATADAGQPTTMTIAAGNGQTAPAGTPVAINPAVLVTDDGGNPVPGVTVTFAVTAGNGAVLGSPATTNSVGVAEVERWTLDDGEGAANTLTASASGLPAVTFTATSGPPPPPPANIAVFRGDNQTSQVGAPIPLAPAVLVTDATGQPSPGFEVTFTVTLGDGTVAGASQITDAFGVARVDEWKLGGVPGTNTLTATVAGLTPVTFTATGEPIDNTAFNIRLRYLSDITPAQQQAFEDAADRWHDVIIGDLGNVEVNTKDVPTEERCTVESPGLDEVVDDLVILVILDEIDGPNEVLGSAGPCFIRSAGTELTVAGVMFFDVADIEQMEAAGVLRDVILHEMGHVLGIGSLWNFSFSGTRELLVDAGTAEPFFVGPEAIDAFQSSGGNTFTGDPVPVEGNASPVGSRDAHWRESVMGRELMTPRIGVGENPLSSITIGSLADIGYVVNPAVADPYTVSATVRLHAGAEPSFELKEVPLGVPIRRVR